MEKLKEAGIDIEYSDPYVKKKLQWYSKKSKPLNNKILKISNSIDSNQSFSF